MREPIASLAIIREKDKTTILHSNSTAFDFMINKEIAKALDDFRYNMYRYELEMRTREKDHTEFMKRMDKILNTKRKKSLVEKIGDKIKEVFGYVESDC